MLYTIASEHWSAENALTPAQARVGLFRTRDEAGRLADGLPTLAVAVRYDSTRGTVVATPPASLRLAGRDWSAPAFINDAGGVVPLCPIPSALVKHVGTPRIHVHAPEASIVPQPGYSRNHRRSKFLRFIAGRISPR